MKSELNEKYNLLLTNLRGLGRFAVAFSGGVDSAFLLYAAAEAVGADNVLAVTADAVTFPVRELDEARGFCSKLGVKHEIFTFDPLAVSGFCDNPPDRCYLCKRELLSGLLDTAKKNGFNALTEGSNTDDIGDYRPGLRALSELDIISPLRAAGFSKRDIRDKSEELDLETKAKPSLACLATRIPYGERITKGKLEAVCAAEDYLRSLGFGQVRVRLHGDKAPIARIEATQQDIKKLLGDEHRLRINAHLKELGFLYVSADLEGYRTGSMNEVL